MSNKVIRSEHWNIGKLKLWDKNPRAIKGERFNELKARLDRLGQIRPLLVTEDGTVIGGNMRLRAMQQLGWSDIWVSVVDAPDDKAIFDVALTDNEEFGFYNKQELAELAITLGLTNQEMATYELNLGSPTSLLDAVDKLNISPDDVPEIAFTEELLEKHNYVVLYFDNEISWLQLQTLYPLKTVAALDSKTGFERLGVGRVIKGEDFINKILDHKDAS